MFALYKPLRNRLRQYDLTSVLSVCHYLMQWMQFDIPLPETLQNWRQNRQLPGRGIGLFEWEIDVLIREALLYCPHDENARPLASWKQLSEIVNEIKSIENDIWGGVPEDNRQDIWWELYRISHRQFPWQQGINHALVLRYFKIYNNPIFAPIFRDATGISAPHFFQLGVATAGHFMRKLNLAKPIRIDLDEISVEDARVFLDATSASLNEIREEIRQGQSYDINWAYVQNAIVRRPLIAMTVMGRDSYVCPSASYVLRAVTEGVYYRLVTANGFANAFGASFQSYVGEVLNISLGQTGVITPEHRYGPRSARKDSVDWIVQVGTASLFIECKTRRPSLEARVELQADNEMRDDIENIVSCIVQTYKTLADAISGQYNDWAPSEHIFPIIVTLEDWYSVGIVRDRIFSRVQTRMREGGYDAELIERYPYTLCSVQELEIACMAMADAGIGEFMQAKTQGEEASWLLGTFTHNNYGNSVENLQALFPEAWGEIHPRMG